MLIVKIIVSEDERADNSFSESSVVIFFLFSPAPKSLLAMYCLS